jgi:phosphate transport system substrate-binding protein
MAKRICVVAKINLKEYTIMKGKIFGSLSVSLALLVCFLTPTAFAAEEIIISGSTTVLPIMQKAGEAFMAANPGISLAISGGGSGNGIKALNEGLCQVAMSSRDIKSSELEQGKARNIQAVRIAIAVDALVPIVHSENPVTGLSVGQLRDIYTGKIRNWKQLGGLDENIVVVSRDSSSGTFETWENMIMESEKVTPAALLQASNGAVVQIVSKNRKAIGYIGFGYLNSSLKKLAVNNVEASTETALSKTWPIARELYVFTNGQPAGGIKKLVDYLLDPQTGQQMVKETGYIPLQK